MASQQPPDGDRLLDSRHDNEKGIEAEAAQHDADATQQQTTSDSKQSSMGSYKPFLLKMCLVLNIVMVLLNVFAVMCLIEEQNYEPEPLESKLCLKCDLLAGHPEDRLEHITRRKNGTVCCADKPVHAPLLMAYFTEHWMKMKQINDNNTFAYCKPKEVEKPKPAIKVVGIATEQQQQETGHKKVVFDYQSGLKINEDPSVIEYLPEHSQVHIKKSGLYHVYSQFLFNHNNGDFEGHKRGHSPLFTHMVVLDQPGNYVSSHRVLMRRSETLCQTGLDSHSTTSYVGSTFQLNKGDRLHVKVHMTHDLTTDAPHMNIFGVHML